MSDHIKSTELPKELKPYGQALENYFLWFSYEHDQGGCLDDEHFEKWVNLLVDEYGIKVIDWRSNIVILDDEKATLFKLGWS